MEAVAIATRSAVTELFQQYPTHTFYYCALVNVGAVMDPRLTAWSVEALDAAAADLPNEPDARTMLAWSYADSPFCFFGEQHFRAVSGLCRELTGPPPCDAEEVYSFGMDAQEEALARLDAEGLFGTGAARTRIVINVESMPPDHTNVERARRLNPPEALGKWLSEAAEEWPSSDKRPSRGL